MKSSVGLLAAFSLFAATGTIINFDTAPLGQTPPGWSASPHWEILKDQSAPTQPYVLAQISNEPADNRCPLAILNSLMFYDGDMSVRIKPVAGHGGGLVWRYRDENNYYLARVSVQEKTVSVYKVQNGQRTLLLPGVRRDIPSNSWSILKISARGNRFQVYMDHRRILQGWDNTFTGSGKVGLWTVADAVTYFDDFRVYPK